KAWSSEATPVASRTASMARRSTPASAAGTRTPPPGTSCTIMRFLPATPRRRPVRYTTRGGVAPREPQDTRPPRCRVAGDSGSGLVGALVVPERLDLAAVLEGHGVAVAVQGAAGGDADPALADAVLLHVLALLAVEQDADPALQG